MDVDELIASLIRDEDRAPRELIGPDADWGTCDSSGHWWLRLHAAFILGLIDGAAAG